MEGFNIYDKQQWCWAHIVRESDTLAVRTGNARAGELAESLRHLYHYIKSGLEQHPPPDDHLYKRARVRLRKILSRARRCKDRDVRKFIDKVKECWK